MHMQSQKGKRKPKAPPRGSRTQRDKPQFGNATVVGIMVWYGLDEMNFLEHVEQVANAAGFRLRIPNTGDPPAEGQQGQGQQGQGQQGQSQDDQSVISRPSARPTLQHSLSESDFTCNCCFELMVHPTSLTCGHSFCRLCLARWVLQSKKKECPECRQFWQGHPKINYALRSILEKNFPSYSERQLEQDRDAECQQKLRQYDQMLQQAESRHKQVAVNQLVQLKTNLFIKGIFATLLVLGAIWVLKTLLFSSDLDQRMSRPVSKWTVEDVTLWAAELGSWTEDTLVPVVKEDGIDGRLLVALDEEDIISVLNRCDITALQRRAFIMALASVRTDLVKPPKTLWEYESRHLARTLFLVYSFPHYPRLTILEMYLFDYADAFLPFVHTSSPVMANLSDVCLYTYQFDSPGVVQWIDIIIKWLFFPYYLGGCFVWSAMFSRHWVLSPYLMSYCLFKTFLDFQMMINLVTGKIPRRQIPVLMKAYWQKLYPFAIVPLLWNFTPMFIITWFIWYELWLRPGILAYDYVNAVVRIRRQQVGQR